MIATKKCHRCKEVQPLTRQHWPAEGRICLTCRWYLVRLKFNATHGNHHKED